jgi:hypothetical protein
VVALVTAPNILATKLRLESELGVSVLVSLDVPWAFVSGYADAARRTAQPELLFDTARLGTEQVLSTVEPDDRCIPEWDCLSTVQADVDGVMAQARLWFDGTTVVLDVDPLDEAGFGGGAGSEVSTLLTDGEGRGGVYADLRPSTHGRAIYALAGLPLDAAVVTFESADGTSVWQRPVAGMVLLLDQPGSGEVDRGQDPSERATGRITILTADGTEIIHVHADLGELATVTDLRIDPVKARVRQGFDRSQDGSQTPSEPLTFEVTRIHGLFGRSGIDTRQAVEVDGGVWVLFDDGVITRFDAASGEVTATASAGDAGRFEDIGAARGWLWAYPDEGLTLLRLDPVTGEITATIQLGAEGLPLDVADSLWVPTRRGLTEIDSETLAVIETHGIPDGSWWEATTDEAIWAYGGGGLVHVDLGSRDLTRIDGSPFYDPHMEYDVVAGVAVDGAVWVPGDNDIVRVDAASFEVTDRIELAARPGDLLHHGDALWTAIPDHGTLVRVDLGSRTVTTVIPLDGAQYRWPLIVGAGLIWTHDGSRLVTVIDPASRQIVESILIDHVISELLHADGAVWAIGNTALTRIQIGG